MNVLIIKNTAAEGPGTIEEYLRAGNIPYSIVDLERGENLPGPTAFSHLVVMGGPMAVYEMDRYAYLKQEADLISQAIKSGRSVLGICLGAQMVAHALGANVYPGNKKEIGWDHVEITPEGMKDPLMSALAADGTKRADVFQWHGDTFDLPRSVVRLAASELFPNQAFRYSDRVYAFQFHVEVTPVIVLEWLKNEQGMDLKKVNTESLDIYASYRLRADGFYRGFFKT